MRRIYLLLVLLCVLIAVPLYSQNERSIHLTRTLDAIGDTGNWPSIVIGTDGFPLITYVDDTNGFLKFIACGDLTCDPTTNIIRTLDDSGDSFGTTSMTLDNNGFPKIAYYDNTNTDLKMVACFDATCASSNIRTLDVADSVGSSNSIAIGDNGNPIISYWDQTNTALKLVFCGDSSCLVDFLDGFETMDDGDGDNVGRETALIINSEGDPVIAYTNATDSAIKTVVCAVNRCNSNREVIETHGQYGQLNAYVDVVIGATGYPIVSYVGPDDQINVLVCNDKYCDPMLATTQVFTESNASVGTSIAIQQNGNPIIAYFGYDDQTFDSYLYAIVCGDSACNPNSADIVNLTPDVVSAGYAPSIAIGSDGVPAVSHRLNSSDDLLFTYVDGLQPEIVTRVYPADGEIVTTTMRTLMWGAVEGAEWYNAQIVADGGSVVMDGWVSAEDACGDSDVCYVLGDSTYLNFPDAVLNGDYELRFGTYDVDTNTSSGLDAATAFTVDVPVPDTPVLLRPQDPLESAVTDIAWEDDPRALWYNVRVTSSGNAIVDQWYYAPTVCDTNGCAVDVPSLASGNYTVELSAWGPGVTGTAYPQVAEAFSVPNNVPTGFNPSFGTAPIFSGEAVLTWVEDPATFWYRITMINARAGIVVQRWLYGGDVCVDGTCYLDVELRPGLYDVRIAGWGVAGIVSMDEAATFLVNEE